MTAGLRFACAISVTRVASDQLTDVKSDLRVFDLTDVANEDHDENNI